MAELLREVNLGKMMTKFSKRDDDIRLLNNHDHSNFLSIYFSIRNFNSIISGFNVL